MVKLSWKQFLTRKSRALKIFMSFDPPIFFLGRHPMKKNQNDDNIGGKYSRPTITMRSGLLILISDRIEIKKKIITSDKEEYFIRIKRSIYQEDITIITYMHKIRPFQTINTWIKTEQKWREKYIIQQ